MEWTCGHTSIFDGDTLKSVNFSTGIAARDTRLYSKHMKTDS